MRVIIAGSRGIYGPEGVEAVRAAIKESTWTITEVITGNARGVDTIADEIAKADGISRVVFPANWNGPKGKGAGYARNAKMAWYACLFHEDNGGPENTPDNLKGGLIAVWDGRSKGTKIMIDLAEANNMPVFVYNLSEKD